MVRGVKLWRDQGPIGGLLARVESAQREDAGQLDLELDVAVLVQIPEKTIFVVLDRGDRRDHEPARAAHLWLVRQSAVGVLPEDAEILLVHAHRILDRQRLPAARAEMPVEILDDAETIAAEFQAVGAIAQAILTRVEGVLAGLLRGGIAVGNDHLGERFPRDRARSVCCPCREGEAPPRPPSRDD